MGMHVREVHFGSDDYRAISRLRYDIYAGEQGLQLEGMNETTAMFQEYCDTSAILLGLFDGDVAIGTSRFTPLPALDPQDPSRQQLEALAAPIDVAKQGVFERLMVRASHRGTAAAMMLLAGSYRVCLERKFELAGLQSNPRLLPFYESLGCRIFGEAIGTEYGMVLPLAFVLRDLEYLAQIQSPLLAVAQEFDCNRALASWLSGATGLARAPASLKMKSEDERSAALKAIHAASIGVLKDLPEEVVAQLLRSASTITVSAGASLLPAGSKSSELYAVLRGRIGLRPPHDAWSAVSLGVGETFAEAGCLGQESAPFPWHAVAETEAEVLAISGETVCGLARRHPAVLKCIRSRLLAFGPCVSTASAATRLCRPSRRTLARTK